MFDNIIVENMFYYGEGCALHFFCFATLAGRITQVGGDTIKTGHHASKAALFYLSFCSNMRISIFQRLLQSL